MTRDSEASLIDFCARQHGAFQESAWLEEWPVRREEMAAACLFLAGVDWYGHHRELLRVGEAIVPGCAAKAGAFLREARFDCLRFSNLLRRELRHASVAS